MDKRNLDIKRISILNFERTIRECTLKETGQVFPKRAEQDFDVHLKQHVLEDFDHLYLE